MHVYKYARPWKILAALDKVDEMSFNRLVPACSTPYRKDDDRLRTTKALSLLHKKGAVLRVRRGYYALTDVGRQLLVRADLGAIEMQPYITEKRLRNCLLYLTRYFTNSSSEVTAALAVLHAEIHTQFYQE